MWIRKPKYRWHSAVHSWERTDARWFSWIFPRWLDPKGRLPDRQL